jgi:alkanesulfonate monooxygenase SsuD/methylene tetrahydromethanopterin reductase-like flavin-dependent oxidoreductase (luciferase family)
MRRLWAGETVEFEGRRATVRPLPYTPGGPFVAYGGGTEVAARRAGRLGMFFIAESHHSDLEAAYNAEAEKAGVAPLGCMFPSADVPLTVFVADDPDKAWAEIGDYLLVDAKSYGEWNAHREGTASVSFATTVDELKSEKGQYQIITPDEAAAYVARGVPLALQPLVGGIPSDIAWRYLETAAAVASPTA